MALPRGHREPREDGASPRAPSPPLTRAELQSAERRLELVVEHARRDAIDTGREERRIALVALLTLGCAILVVYVWTRRALEALAALRDVL